MGSFILYALLSIGFLNTALLLSGCGDNDDDSTGSVTLLLQHRVDAEDVALNEGTYTNAAGNTYRITRLEYLLSDIALEQADGTRFTVNSEHYVNLSRHSTLDLFVEDVPAGTYTNLQFYFGLNSDRNHAGGLPSTASFNSMEWPESLGGGYHYMKFEGLYEGAGGTTGFAVHTGPSGGDDFSFQVNMPLALEVNDDDWEIRLLVNLNQWFTQPQTYDLANFGGIMGNADAQTIIQGNGISVFSLGTIHKGDGKHLDDDDDHDDDHDDNEDDDHEGHTGDNDEEEQEHEAEE